MQLVSIFSTILLGVATIVLAVAAYFLYTIRERLAHMERLCKQAPAVAVVDVPEIDEAPEATPVAEVPEGVAVAKEPEAVAVDEEPEAAVAPARAETSVPPEPRASIMAGVSEAAPTTIFWEYTDEGFVPVHPIVPGPEAEPADDDDFAWL